jgi:hypothetical protein
MAPGGSTACARTDLKGYLERFWEDALASFKEIAESETGGNDDQKTE